MSVSNLKRRIKKLEDSTGSNRRVYIPMIYRFGEEVPPVKFKHGVIVKDFTGNVLPEQWFIDRDKWRAEHKK